jgi:hypothetical protein
LAKEAGGLRQITCQINLLKPVGFADPFRISQEGNCLVVNDSVLIQNLTAPFLEGEGLLVYADFQAHPCPSQEGI